MSAEQSSAPKAALAAPVQAVFDNYIKVQGALARDSLAGVADAASAMTKGVQGDASKALSPKVAQQAEALAKAKDLAAARAAFKPLSDSLIQAPQGAEGTAGDIPRSLLPDGQSQLAANRASGSEPLHGQGNGPLRSVQKLRTELPAVRIAPALGASAKCTMHRQRSCKLQ